MAYLSLYRKYRSQSFEEVSGQDHVTRTLQNALRSGRVAHAYLLCGPRGTGKTTTARLLAKALNCEAGPTAEPCNHCDACVQIAEGRYLDLKEIDAASNRGIDDIRALRDTVAYAPSDGRYKVYVIDEAHQMTVEAFNALLKTLEEPPPYVVFVLATTEAHKIPATIVSRCQRFDFRRATLEQLRERVAFVAEHEGAVIESAALDLIARDANGGWRDALSLLEQVLAFCDGEITARHIYTVLGTVEADALHALAELIHRADGAVWGMVDGLIAEGKDPRQLLHDLTAHYRVLMLTAAGAPQAADPEMVERIDTQARLYGQRRLVGAIQILAQTEREARWSEQPRLLLELAVARLIQGIVPARAEQSSATVNAADPAPEPASAAPRGAVPDARPVQRPVAERAPATHELPPPPLNVGDARAGSSGDDDDLDTLFALAAREEASPVPPPAQQRKWSVPPVSVPPVVEAVGESEPEAAPAGGEIDLELLRRKWKLVREELKRNRKINLFMFLVDTQPHRVERDSVVIHFASKSMADVFNERGNSFYGPLLEAIQQVVGFRCRVRAEVGGDGAQATPAPREQRPDAGRPVSGTSRSSAPEAAVSQRRRDPPPVAAPPVTAPPASAPPASAPPTKAGAGGGELIHNVLDVFDGQIMDTHET